jgi:hypothetical protein
LWLFAALSPEEKKKQKTKTKTKKLASLEFLLAINHARKNLVHLILPSGL